MDLDRTGREIAHVTFTAFPGNGYTVQCSVDRQTWVDMDTQPVQQADGTWLGAHLLRGPDFAGDSQGLLVRANTHLWVRVNSNPEVVPRNAGQVRLV